MNFHKQIFFHQNNIHLINEIIICLISSQSFSEFLFTDKKSSERNIPLTPFIDNIFLTSSFEV